MAAHSVSCPGCQSRVAVRAMPTRAICVRCSRRFVVGADGATALLPDNAAVPGAAGSLPMLAIVLGGGLLFVLTGMVLVAVCLFAGRESPESDLEPPALGKGQPKVHVLEPVSFIKTGPKKSDGAVAAIQHGKAPGEGVAGVAKPICGDAALVENQEQINAAIRKGVAFLQERCNGQGHFANDPLANRLGAAALVGLTLLSCGESPGDPKVAGLIARVRKEAPVSSQTYDLAAAIWFLDKLGDPQDRELIRTIALRLMAGQNAAGGWHYTCNVLRPEDERAFLQLLDDQPYFSLPTGVPAGDKAGPAGKGNGPKTGPDKALRNKSWPVAEFQPGKKLPQIGVAGDNSNTQFAVLALWAAQKYGVPAQRSLAMVEARFRQTQHANGTWGYNANDYRFLDSMTCAGLIGLAVGHGLAQPGTAALQAEDKRFSKDPLIEKALVFVGFRLPVVRNSLRRQGPAQLDDPAVAQLRKELAEVESKLKTAKLQDRAPLQQRQRVLKELLVPNINALGDFYYLWSVERVAVIYGLTTIGGTDWYGWGSDILLTRQDARGCWHDKHSEVVDTCFALLFLKRVNVAQDLTKVLKDLGGARDPGALPGNRTPMTLEAHAEIKEEPNVAPGRVKTRTGYKAPAKTG